MQIFCNNCGNDLHFSDAQHLVTCPHCYTHLEIEEKGNIITATIVENPNFDNTIFQQSTNLSNIEYLAPLFNLLHLEGEYDEIIEDNFFYSVLGGKKNRPMLLRGLYRLGFTAISLLYALKIFSDTLVFQIPWFAVLLGSYGIFLFQASIKELIRKKRLWEFEKRYFKEKEVFLEKLGWTNNSNLQKDINALHSNHDDQKAIRKEFFNVKLFNKFSIPIGMPSVSKGLRFFAIAVPFGSIGLIYGFEGYSIAFLLTILAIVLVFFGFFILADVSEYNRVEGNYQQNRKTILKRLNKFASQYL